MTTIAYFDCFSGAAGDMLVAALLDAGLCLDDLRADLAQLGVQGYELELRRVQQHGITGSHFDVIDLAGERPVRNLSLIRGILGGADLPEPVLMQSLRVFTRLAEAEARIHGVDVDEVHFHEVGAIDALVDIVGCCAGLHRLGVEAVYASPLPLGSGTIRTEHGLLPVPAPATLALLAEVGAPTVPLDARSELVTPTGAALLTTLATFERPAMRVQRVGYGFGTKTFPWANMVRVWIGEALTPDARGPWTGALPVALPLDEPKPHTHEHLSPGGAHTHPHPQDDHRHGDAHGPEHTHGDEHAHPHDHPHPHSHPHEQATDDNDV